MTLKFYTSVAKELILKVRTFCGLSPTFEDVTRKKLVGRSSPKYAFHANQKKIRKFPFFLDSSPAGFM